MILSEDGMSQQETKKSAEVGKRPYVKPAFVREGVFEGKAFRGSS